MVGLGKKNSFVRGGYRLFKKPALFNNFEKKKNKKISINYYRLSKTLLIVIIFLVLVYSLFFSKFFKVKDILVEGNNYISTEKITSIVRPGRNIFMFNSGLAEKQIIAAFSEIHDVHIYRGIPNALKIVVLEREGKIVWESNGKKYLISSLGEVMRELSDTDSSNFPLIKDVRNFPVNPGEQLVSPSFIAFISNIKQNFFASTGIQPTFFEIQTTTFDVYLHTGANFYVKFNSLRSSVKQLDNLKLVLADKREKISEYVDLRIDGWAYYK